MRIGRTNAIFGGGVVYNFVPFVAPESFNDPRKYADYGLTVNLYEKFRIYKMTYPSADIAVEYSDAIASVLFTKADVPSGSIIEIFETISGVETSKLIRDGDTYYFTSGSTKRYMIRRITSLTKFTVQTGSVWAYCFGVNSLETIVGIEPYLKYIFFYEYTLTDIGTFRDKPIKGTLKLNGGITNIPARSFEGCNNLTKVITGDSVSTITGGNTIGAFNRCTGLQIADLGEGMTSIGQDTFRDCTSLQVIYLRSHIPPTITAATFRNVPSTTIWKVPAEDLATYKGWTNYTTFASRIFAI